jgi:hypothetical protein
MLHCTLPRTLAIVARSTGLCLLWRVYVDLLPRFALKGRSRLKYPALRLGAKTVWAPVRF